MHKVVANCLRTVLGAIVGKQQVAFLSGRRIGDNILLVQELLRYYYRDEGFPLKVDLNFNECL